MTPAISAVPSAEPACRPAASAGRLPFREFLAQLDQHRGSIPLDVLERGLARLEIQPEEIAHCLRFGDATYRRNLIHEGPSYQALILCWRAGQRSPIHDHSGSACGVRVLAGEALETVFERVSCAGGEHIFASRTNSMREGYVCATFDSDIHQISNLSPEGTDLVTLHIYSPPLMKMGTYSLMGGKTGEFVDPVHNCLVCDGGGI